MQPIEPMDVRAMLDEIDAAAKARNHQTWSYYDFAAAVLKRFHIAMSAADASELMQHLQRKVTAERRVGEYVPQPRDIAEALTILADGKGQLTLFGAPVSNQLPGQLSFF